MGAPLQMWSRNTCGIKVDCVERTLGEGCRSSVTAATACIQPNGKRRTQSELGVGPAVRAVSKAKHQDYRVLSIDSCAMTCAAFVVADGGRCTVHFLHLHFLFTAIG